jgi:putative ABC transport system permease protein
MVNNNNMMTGGVLFGVDEKKEALINKIYKKATKTIDEFDKYHLIAGQGIKDELSLNTYQKVTLYFSKTTPSGFSSMPRMKRFTYLNSFKSGLTAYDKAYLYTSIEALQTIMQKQKNSYDGIHIFSNSAFEDIKKIAKTLPNDVGIVGWWQQNGNLFSAMEMEKRALFLVLMLIILMASLNIISSLLMTVMSRRKEIALLLSQGASQKEIKYIFLKLGLIVGSGGIILGTILGFFGMFLLKTFDIISLPADVYPTSKLPLILDNTDFALIILGSCVIVFLSSYYPAIRATKINVLDVLKNE